MMTLVADGSYGGGGAAGWAAWAKSDGQPSILDGGRINYVHVPSNYEAEIIAILFGLRMATAYAPGATGCLVQSDCERALRLVRWHTGCLDSPKLDGGIRIGCGPMRPHAAYGARGAGPAAAGQPPVPAQHAHLRQARQGAHSHRQRAALGQQRV